MPAVRCLQAWRSRVEDPRHKPMLESRAALPAWSKAAELVDAVRDCQVVMVVGETGATRCGPSPEQMWTKSCTDVDRVLR